jgi:hypothetical protein
MTSDSPREFEANVGRICIPFVDLTHKYFACIGSKETKIALDCKNSTMMRKRCSGSRVFQRQISSTPFHDNRSSPCNQQTSAISQEFTPNHFLSHQ